MAKELTQKELAAALGISQPRATQLKREGMPVSSVRAAQKWRAASDPAAAFSFSMRTYIK